MKSKLLPGTKEIISMSTTYQEYDERLTKLTKKRSKKVINVTAKVKFWGLVAILKNSRIKVIVRQIGNGQKHFWTIIPAWHTRNIRILKYFHSLKTIYP